MSELINSLNNLSKIVESVLRVNPPEVIAANIQDKVATLFADIAGITPERRRELDAEMKRAQEIRDNEDPTPEE